MATQRTVRSLADLRSILPEPPVTHDGGPYIPCANCGTNLPYSRAVPRMLDEGFVGYAHREGQCSDENVGEWRRRTTAVSTRTARLSY